MGPRFLMDHGKAFRPLTDFYYKKNFICNIEGTFNVLITKILFFDMCITFQIKTLLKITPPLKYLSHVCKRKICRYSYIKWTHKNKFDYHSAYVSSYMNV